MKTRLQKTGESLQEYASEVERLTNLTFSDHPATHCARSNLLTVFSGRPEGGGSPERYATCESPWKSDIEKLRDEFLAFKDQRQNQEKSSFQCWGCGVTGHLRRNCSRSRKDEKTVSSHKQEN
ncbi:hypothetical protein TNCV_1405771 [Trichonephila clavipes]|nr:hypothetical protein TNCV_1405771 [Trichonephila clavipes]